MGIPLPEDGSRLTHWKARRAIRNFVWLVGGLVIVYLLGLSLQLARENQNLGNRIQTQYHDFEDRIVRSLAGLLLQVQTGEAAAVARGEEAKITLSKAVAALKESFPGELVDRAVKEATASSSTTMMRQTPTARATTTTTASAGSPGPPGPPGPAGPTAGVAPTTTTTSKPCAIGLDVPGLMRLCLTEGD